MKIVMREYPKVILVLCLLISFSGMYSQVSDVTEAIEESYENYQDAFNKLKNARSYISDAFNAESISGVQSYANYAESEVSSAKRYLGYAEDEADDAETEAGYLNCYDAKNAAEDAEDYFYDAKRNLSNAESSLSSASYTSDADYLSDYLNEANNYINQALNNMGYAVDELNNTLKYIRSCGVPTSNSYSGTSQTTSCEDLLSYIQDNGYRKSKLSSYTLDSSWLYEVTAYTYDYDIYVVAKIKKSEYSYQTNTYIFCGVPSTNWSNFKNGGYGDPNSYGKRFHKYIFDYKCECY
ncbi:hypothetical protein [Corallibacter sp.]|uniref:hypothetical protein n=1 Tax=Corallibacter sp. TaxID=2038084 RepID=UPI003AB8AB42